MASQTEELVSLSEMVASVSVSLNVSKNSIFFLFFPGPSFSSHNGFKFSTFDKDQDTHATNCAKSYLGGWWYKDCHSVNPNGLYAWGTSTFGVGINWESWKGYEYSLKAITMKIKPRDSNANK